MINFTFLQIVYKNRQSAGGKIWETETVGGTSPPTRKIGKVCKFLSTDTVDELTGRYLQKVGYFY